jgi:hypothetical protein
MVKTFVLIAFVMTASLLAEDLSGRWVGTMTSGNSSRNGAANVYLIIRE